MVILSNGGIVFRELLGFLKVLNRLPLAFHVVGLVGVSFLLAWATLGVVVVVSLATSNLIGL